MNSIFGYKYADAYDTLYHDKNYSGECDLVEDIFKTHIQNPVHSILDLGCGTGNHAILLARRGYRVIGIDRSDDMLAHAHRKAEVLQESIPVDFHQGNIHDIRLREHFDAVLMMFNVLGYQLDDSDVLSTFKTARSHLQAGGLFIFDLWYGPAVLNQGPSDRVKVIPNTDGRVVRMSSGKLDIHNHVCKVHFRLQQLEKGQSVIEAEETHTVRYFFMEELTSFLQDSGFDLIRAGAFPEFSRKPDETTWNILVVAKTKSKR